MVKLMVSGVIVLVTVFKHGSEAHETVGIHCNVTTQTWRNAEESCARSCTGGSLVSYVTGIGKPGLRSEADVWTADYAIRHTGHNHDYENLCGFVYADNSSTPFNIEGLYGSCSVERYYLCMEEGKWVVYQSTWHEINHACNKSVHEYNSIKPGFYWIQNSKDFSFKRGTTLPTTGSVLCGAYSPNIGQYFTNCDNKRTSLCLCSSNAVQSLDKSCFISTTIGSSTHSITSTVNTLQSTENESMAESTPSLQSSENQNMVDLSTNLNRITIQNHQFEGRRKEENDSDLSVEVGLPVGLCLTLITGITLTIYLVRRYKCLTRKPEFNENNHRNTKSTRNSHYSFGGANAHINASYEANEEIVIKIKGNHKLNNVSKPSNRNIQNHSDANSEYAVVYKSKRGKVPNSDNNKQNAYCYASGYKDNCANSNEVQTADYSFAKETCTEEAYNGVMEEEYDVTGNVLRDTSNVSSDIYNHFQNNDYDSTAGVSGNNCNDMYDVTQNQRSESVYDSTEQLQSSTRCDNVYNNLS